MSIVLTPGRIIFAISSWTIARILPASLIKLQEGDIVSLDAGVIYQGYQSDSARTHAVGEISAEDRRLIDITKQSFFECSDLIDTDIICLLSIFCLSYKIDMPLSVAPSSPYSPRIS